MTAADVWDLVRQNFQPDPDAERHRADPSRTVWVYRIPVNVLSATGRVPGRRSYYKTHADHEWNR